ncbi:MAG: metallophosphoesterase [Cetobacterium sp.]
MIFILQRLLPVVLFIMTAAYFFSKVYSSLWFFLIVPLISFSPFIFFYFLRENRSDIFEIALGHYLFYLNYILIGGVSIVLISFILKLFSLDLLGLISQKKMFFHIFILLFFIGLSYIGNRNFQNILVENYEVPSQNINLDKDLKFAFISDIHLNGKFDGSKLRESFKKMEDEGVELVLIGGDFLDNSYKTVTDDIKSIIDATSFKHGIYLALGNHEYYGGIDENINYIKTLGINILRDESVEIEGVTIIGRDDRHNKNRKSLDELLKNVESENTVIVVDHNPESLKELKGEKVDLYLSGHTHRGQIFPFNLLVDYMYENSRGYKKINNTHSYVSSGLGTWMIPYRIGSQSEMFILNLMAK